VGHRRRPRHLPHGRDPPLPAPPAEGEGWLTLLKFWDGLSSYGGFFGAILMLTVFYRDPAEAPLVAGGGPDHAGLILGWIFGRFGCTVSGDHPGRAPTSLGLSLPGRPAPQHGPLRDGLHDRRALPGEPAAAPLQAAVGSYVAMNCLLYGAGRFALDFLRATDRTDSDPRYLGLTLAHYLSGGIFVFGLVVALLAKARKLEPAPALAPPVQK
jgi:phosphatidylglycerol:prolipoprotein diacylglycerol transferase